MKLITVKSVKKNVNQNVYDIKVEEDSHYILKNGLVSHNSGVKYAASTIVYLSKKKDKDSDGLVVGNIIKCNLFKSRFTKENKVVEVQLNYDTGLNKYHGLVNIALKQDIFKKVSTKIQLPDGSTAFEKHIMESPEKYFTDKVMALLEEAAAREFKYGQTVEGSDVPNN
jgi:hypothetical protein